MTGKNFIESIKMRREFLMLANKLTPKHNVAGWYVSRKLDGTRAFWDGGISREAPVVSVPYANLYHPKTGELKVNETAKATGLWSRYGNVIHAPDWFLNQLPCCFLDGELWCGTGSFQECRSIVSRDVPDNRWDKVKFVVFGSPSRSEIFKSGEIKNPQFTRTVSASQCDNFLLQRMPELTSVVEGATFEDELTLLSWAMLSEGPAYLHRQVKLGNDPWPEIEIEMEKALANGDEGLVLRAGNKPWNPKRVSWLLKFKPFSDDEGTLVGFTSGRETDKGSKLLGKIGALVLDYSGKRLELSGLTDEERLFLNSDMADYATEFPGLAMPDFFQGKHFKVGDTITFKYRELSDDGIPKEARYMRPRNEE
jgi:DNA ligase-1